MVNSRTRCGWCGWCGYPHTFICGFSSNTRLGRWIYRIRLLGNSSFRSLKSNGTEELLPSLVGHWGRLDEFLQIGNGAWLEVLGVRNFKQVVVILVEFIGGTNVKHFFNKIFSQTLDGRDVGKR